MSIAIDPLLGAVRGTVIEPGDADYEAARQVMMRVYDRRPAVIVKVADAADVATVVTVARETGMELAVRSGGHSAAGHGTTDGGILLDLSRHEGHRHRCRRPHRLGRGRPDRRRAHDGPRRTRPCRRIRRHRIRRDRRHHGRWRDRLPRAQVRPDDRFRCSPRRSSRPMARPSPRTPTRIRTCSGRSAAAAATSGW